MTEETTGEIKHAADIFGIMVHMGMFSPDMTDEEFKFAADRIGTMLGVKYSGKMKEIASLRNSIVEISRDNKDGLVEANKYFNDDFNADTRIFLSGVLAARAVYRGGLTSENAQLEYAEMAQEIYGGEASNIDNNLLITTVMEKVLDGSLRISPPKNSDQS